MAELTEFAQLGQDFARVRPNLLCLWLKLPKWLVGMSWNVVWSRKSADIASVKYAWVRPENESELVCQNKKIITLDSSSNSTTYVKQLALG